jgi:hypothetical protein
MQKRHGTRQAVSRGARGHAKGVGSKSAVIGQFLMRRMLQAVNNRRVSRHHGIPAKMRCGIRCSAALLMMAGA